MFSSSWPAGRGSCLVRVLPRVRRARRCSGPPHARSELRGCPQAYNISGCPSFVPRPPSPGVAIVLLDIRCAHTLHRPTGAMGIAFRIGSSSRLHTGLSGSSMCAKCWVSACPTPRRLPRVTGSALPASEDTQGAGEVQLVLTAALLKKMGYAWWDLGMTMKYKAACLLCLGRGSKSRSDSVMSLIRCGATLICEPLSGARHIMNPDPNPDVSSDCFGRLVTIEKKTTNKPCTCKRWLIFMFRFFVVSFSMLVRVESKCFGSAVGGRIVA